MFETIVDKETPVIPKNEKAPHPFIIYIGHRIRVKTERLNLDITFLGKAIDYIPYFFHSLRKAGELGIQRQRTKFTIMDVTIDGMSIIKDQENIKMQESFKIFDIATEDNSTKKRFRIEFKTPFRIKKEGRLVRDFEANDLFNSVYRRLFIINALYGDRELPDFKENNSIRIVEENFFWKDLTHYSARQRDTLKLGGIMGSFVLEGEFTPFEISLLKGAELFNVGKNVSFGLGRVEVKGEG